MRVMNEQTARTDHRGDTPDEMTSPLAANDETKPTLQRLQPDQLFSIFNQLSTALWIFDFDCKRVLWANRAGLEAWDAGSVEDWPPATSRLTCPMQWRSG